MNKKNAFAMSIVLWIVAALLFGVATLTIIAKDTLYLSQGIKEKLSSELLAQDILEVIKFYITTAKHDQYSFRNSNINNLRYKVPNQIIVDNRWYNIHKNIKFRIQDTSGLINVYNANSSLISNLATTLRQEKFFIKDSIDDWKDPDNIVKLNGAEQSRYETNPLIYYKIRNSPAIQSVQELKLILGLKNLSNEKWKNLKKYLYYANSSKINLLLIDSSYLASILNIDNSKAKAYIDEREKSIPKFITLIKKEKHFTSLNMGFSLSKQLKFEIETTSPTSKSILKTLIDFRSRNSQYSTIFYELK